MKSKRRQKPPPRRGPLYTPKARQARIIAASLAGRSQRQIAREVGADRETVRRVLSQSEVQALLDAYRDRLRSIVPDALSQFEHELAILPKGKRQHVRKDTLWAAAEVLKGPRSLFPGVKANWRSDATGSAR